MPSEKAIDLRNNDTLLNPFGTVDYKEADKYQEQVDQRNPTLQEILTKNSNTTDLDRRLTDSINTDYLD
jgi:hypothetical protein|tara:strand:- start:4316 stop:4522 length:207 start_codon:yes stop_codon:yes gene_type:complete